MGIMGLKIDVYVMIHNEEFMLPYFLRHYDFARRIFVFEDQSTDKSREILECNSKVMIIEPKKHGINEKYWTNILWPMYETLSRGIADYVFQVDADEFVYHPKLINILEQEKSYGIQQIFCPGYTMVSEKLPTMQGQIYDEIKLGLPDRWSSKWVIFSPDIHLRYGDGRHKILETTATKVNVHSGIKILHYRWLGQEYFEERDKRNRLRFNVTDKVDLPYDPDRRHNLPDGSRGIKLEWYTEHKYNATNVVDG